MAAEVRPIRTKQDYEAALKEVERLWGAKSGTRDGDRLDVLATLIDAYEAEHYPIADTANSTDCVPFVLADSNKSDRRSARMSTEHLKMDGCWSHSTREIALWLAVSCILLAAIG